MIGRYREERRHGRSVVDAISATGGTATKAVVFSGLTVVFSLAGLAIVPNSIFRSLGLGAILVVLVAVLATLTLVPAIVNILKDRIDWPIRQDYDDQASIEAEFARDQEEIHSGFWGRIAKVVMDHPWPAMLLSAGFLILLAIPYFDMNTGFAGVDTLPESEVRSGFDILETKFAAGRIAPVEVVVDVPRTPESEDAIASFSNALVTEQGFSEVRPPVWNEAGDLALVQATLPMTPTDPEAYDTVEVIRDQTVPTYFDPIGAEVYVSGDTAFNQDFFDLIDQVTPYVFVFVLGLSFLLLMVAFRSIVVPAKAIIMNLLSVGAAYGALVLVFQKGYGADLFGFMETPTIEAWIPLFLFAVLFGLSMDYQVFLLSRIREHYDLTHDNRVSVATGLQATAKIITGAAAIMVAVFIGFALGDLVMFQQFGFGLAVAIALDATLVRSVLVPSTMRLLGDWNWYLPSWLQWLPDLRIEGTPRQRPEVSPETRPVIAD